MLDISTVRCGRALGPDIGSTRKTTDSIFFAILLKTCATRVIWAMHLLWKIACIRGPLPRLIMLTDTSDVLMKVQTYLRDNLQDVLVDRADEGPRLGTREFGRRNVFIVTAVSEQRYANIELSRQSKSKRAVERGRFFFHEDEIDAIDTDWGYWSEHPQWMSREDRSKASARQIRVDCQRAVSLSLP
ncbi:hypothetical protein PLICRDRAFT_345931 [Plicaturopsis crispa FD-325 SS-3]|uniref:Uncharacterized protein n=1 Tax=Plicaturopsis crispa FD-325 SS-3 TaxID=944288 RepID=A0A0C9SRP9_PLICR|nr:hypothetical protein PLICRDRAFT_345931 [Plicaturopsis crispa FD-325 SS-3]